MHPLHFLNHLEHDQVVAAIRNAESHTAGHIRLVVSKRKIADPIASAGRHLAASDMHGNGILLFVAPRSKKFAVVGDRVVHQRVGDAAWRGIAETIEGHFKRGQFMAGVIAGVERAGELLAAHFPKAG